MNWQPGYHNIYLPSQVKLRPIVQHLLGMEPRIRLCLIYGDIEENKGWFLTKHNIYLSHELPKAEHEICHLVELKDSNRWTIPDWGFPAFETSDVAPKAFFAALAREIRVRAIQCHLEPEAWGNDGSTTYDQFASPFWYGTAEKLVPFGRFKTMKDLTVWMADVREHTHKRWSLDRIEHEWKVRLSHIQNWMETQPENQHGTI